jgi:hypothetical protein
MVYDDEVELTRYVWAYYQHLMTDFERRVGRAILGRAKAAAAADSPVMARTINERLGAVGDPAIETALANGPDDYRRQVCKRLMTEYADTIQVKRCPQCARVVRTPRARQCFWCGNDWHDDRTPVGTPGAGGGP